MTTSAGRHAYAVAAPGARVAPLWLQPISFLAIGLLTLVLSILAGIAALIVASLAGADPGPSLVERWEVGLAVWIFSSVVLIGVVRWWVSKVERRSLDSAGLGRAELRGQAPWGVVGAVWAFGLATCLLAIYREPGEAQRPFLAMAEQPLVAAGLLPLLGLIVVFGATAEEVFFRGWLLSSLSFRIGPIPALVCSSLVFASFHVFPGEWGDPARLVSLLAYAAAGAAFGALALSQGHVWGASAFHAAFNAVLLWLALADAGFRPQEVWGKMDELGSDSLREALMWFGLEAALALSLLRLWLARRRL